MMKLDLSGLELEEVPPEIAQCKQLETLLLGNCFDYYRREETNNLTKFPDAVLRLTNLKILNLNHNQITSIPEAIRQLSTLRELYLGSNQITSIPEALGRLSNLTKLYLNSNQITSIPEALGRLSNLTELHPMENKGVAQLWYAER